MRGDGGPEAGAGVTPLYRLRRDAVVQDWRLVSRAVAVLTGAGPDAYLALAEEIERRRLHAAAARLAALDRDVYGPQPALSLARRLAWTPPLATPAAEVLCRSAAVLIARELDLRGRP